ACTHGIIGQHLHSCLQPFVVTQLLNYFLLSHAIPSSLAFNSSSSCFNRLFSSISSSFMNTSAFVPSVVTVAIPSHSSRISTTFASTASRCLGVKQMNM